MKFMKNRAFAMIMAVLMVVSTVFVGMPGVVAEAATANVTINASGGWYESAYVQWSSVSGATAYKVYVKAASAGDSAYVQLDDQLVRRYSSYWRADALGLKAGDYVLKVEAVLNSGSVTATTGTLKVNAYDRSGFAFSKDSTYKTGSGAYNDDGTLKSNALVLYVTKDNAKTISADIITSNKGAKTTYTGLQDIITGLQKGYETRPVDIRLVGCITKDDLDRIDSSEEGLQIKGKNGYSNLNLTIEGVGDDAAIYGFGMLLRNAANVELRNFAVLHFMDDGISIDTDNCNLWIHNLEIYYGQTGSAADQKKGDGSIDVKGNSKYVTISYVHFVDSGKCSLCGMKSESGPNYITYHHNWFDHSDSRHPRIRTMSVHVYNNYFDGNSKYGVGVTMGSSAFVQNNYFRNCLYPMLASGQGTDAQGEGTFSGETGGIIKAYGNTIVGAKQVIYANKTSETNTAANSTQFDAYAASSATETVPSTYKTVSGGTTYNNFDTTVDLGVKTVDTADAAKTNVIANAGTQGGMVIPWTFSDSADTSYSIDTALKSAVTDYNKSAKYNSLLSVGGKADGSGAGQQPTMYTVSVTNGTATPSSAAAGTTVTVKANTIDKKEFTGWTVSSGNVTLSNTSTATFTMPNGNVSITANYKDATTGGESGGESGEDVGGETSIELNTKALYEAGYKTKGSLNGKTIDGFTFTDSNSSPKAVVDENTANFGTADKYDTYTHRYKTGGASGNKNNIMFETQGACRIAIAARTGSNDATDRAICIGTSLTDKSLLNKILLESDAITTTIDDKGAKIYPYIYVDIPAKGTYYITYPTNGVNIYNISVVKESGNDPEPNTEDKEKTGLILENGKLTYYKNGVIDTEYEGIVYYEPDDAFYVCRNGYVDLSYDGLCYSPYDGNFWACKDGKVDFGYNYLIYSPYDGNFWACKDGKVDFEYDGLCYSPYDGNFWACKEGKVNFDYNYLIYSPYDGNFWACKDGKVDFGYDGLSYSPYDGNFWACKEGKVAFDYEGLSYSPYDGNFWACKEGKVMFDYNGLIYSPYDGNYYIAVNGKVDFDYNGEVVYNGVTYKVSNGRAEKK